ncbi:DUF3301 domain-containing protein [Aliiglaciecola sp. LCG003]|uniref:DUF3301 domain-containing protein n=1 Tax=Aliiglaciecola sp. LCG003 TaxID=3053655 RepID=UPI00257291B7|nr:DUF3301 domain-containing protein [Aliiglaciecola sp. LCG003]WJG08546.1 DUF3301 domain-containing protein [Aliiglaciecola sp. LCG003]
MQFNLFDILLFVIIAAVGFQFWRIRAISEKAKAYLEQYCDKQALQFISAARSKTRLTIYKAKLDWYTEFDFEFSSTGEESYHGLLTMRGLNIVNTELPAYRIN